MHALNSPQTPLGELTVPQIPLDGLNGSYFYGEGGKVRGKKGKRREGNGKERKGRGWKGREKKGEGRGWEVVQLVPTFKGRRGSVSRKFFAKMCCSLMPCEH